VKHTVNQVLLMITSLRELAVIVKRQPDWASRNEYDPRPIRRLLESLLKKYGTYAPLDELLRLAVAVDPLLHDKGHTFIIWKLVNILQEVSHVAAKDKVAFLAIVDKFLGALKPI
jgi:hypothetical protein